MEPVVPSLRVTPLVEQPLRPGGLSWPVCVSAGSVTKAAGSAQNAGDCGPSVWF